MSERIQKNAKHRADAARQREQNARQRARSNEERGDLEMARLHRNSADLQADAAVDAETLLELDREVEGDQLGQ
jgi:hypothetical protein